MPTIYKVLGQVNPANTTLTSVYTVPSSTQAVISSISICNLGVSTTYRIAIAVAGATLANNQYIVYDAAVNSNDSAYLTLGITLGATDVVSVYAGTANVSFSVFGSEIS
jgi:hypothetical protein